MTKNKNASLEPVCFAVLLCLAMVFPLGVQAQTDTVKAKQLKEVQINAKRHRTLPVSATPAQTLSGEELKRINSLSVADAVRYFTGVQLKDYGGIGGLKTINVRSMGSNHTSVFYDGVQLGNAQNGQVDLGKYSLDNMAEISLYSGQKGGLLQPAKAFASASALYLKTPIPKFEGKNRSQFRAGLKGGSFGLIDPALHYSQKINNRLSFHVNGELINANGKYKYRYTNGVYDTTVVRHNGDVFAKRLEAGLYATLADSSQWRLQFYNYNSERGIPGAIVSNKFDFKQRQWDDNFFVQSSYQAKTKNYQLLANAKYAYDFTRYLDPSIQSLSGALDNRYTQQELYFSLANQYQLTSYWAISLAMDYSYQQLDANLKYFAYPARQSGLIALATSFKWPQFELQANMLATLISEKVENFTPAGSKKAYTPTIMASWQPFEEKGFRLRAFYKSIFRLPTFNDLYYTFIGNTNLRPEYTRQYNLGFSYLKTFEIANLLAIAVQTDVYYNQVKDKIVAVPTVNLFKWTMLNLDAVSIKGVEASIQSDWQFGKLDLTAKLGYTSERALDVTKTGFTYHHQIPYIPVHSGSFTLGANWARFGCNYSFIYTGDRYSQKANIPVNYVPAWYTHDLAIHKSFTLRKVNYRVATELNNLFNQYYDVVLNYPMPGRNFRISLTANF